MSTIDDIKERLRIEEIVGRRVQLTRSGKHLRGLCPFHSEKTPSFFVFEDTQRFKCFGCGAGGDVVDFVMQLEGWDMQSTLRELAREAHIELRPLSPEEKRAIELTREKETVFAIAAEWFHTQMGAWDTKAGRFTGEVGAGLAYARKRGFSDETIRAAALGWFGEDWDGLRSCLASHKVAMDAPAVVALVGFRGDVAAWATAHGLQASERWIEQGKIPAMPPQMLIYPHVLAGRVTYLSGRRIAPEGDAPKSWNPPRELAGERQPFFNALWGQKAPAVVSVEGQACAITLAQWGVPAAALAGISAAANPTLLAQTRKAAGNVVIGMDTDDAGKAAVAGTAAALMEAGIRPTQIRVVTWPAHDANDWLQAGATAEQVQALLADSPHWVDVLTERAAPKNGGEADDAGMRELFAVLARLDAYDLARVRERICDQLGIRRSEFDTILRTTRRETGLSDDGRQKYQVVSGQTCHRYYDKGGNEVCDVLAHFDARITAEVVEDDGSRQERRFTIEGKLADGAKLPEVEVAAADYPAMSWVLETWGAKALIEAGAATKDHLRAAIQLLSPAAPTRYIYSHLGWRMINGQPVYLGTTGAVGYEGVEVRVIQDLARYKLPVHPEHPKEAMEASLRFLEVGDYAVTIPLWAAMYLAPLSSIIEPAFTLWVFGTTGSLKSTITALALCHFGTFAYNTPPASWTGTANALEKKAFLVKDAPLWIDDYVTQSTFGGMNELRAKVDQLLRDWGNRAGRSRMRADLSLRQTFAPRGLIISTAEQLPQGQSIQARLFQIEVDPTMITRGGGSPLTAAQTEEALLYPHAMGGYLLWLAEQMKGLEEQLPQKLLDYTEAAREKGAHLRMPMNVASLFVGWELGLQYARQVGTIDAEKYEALHGLGWDILVGLGEAQRVAAEEEKPVEMYLGAIEEMLAQGSVYLKNRWYPELPDREFPTIANRMAGAELIGWYGNDEQDGSTYAASRYWYLIPGVTYKGVVEFYRSSGVVFPDTTRGIKVKLKEQKLLFPSADRPFDYRMTAMLPRVLRVVKPIDSDNASD